jgi:hypothetical protein
MFAKKPSLAGVREVFVAFAVLLLSVGVEAQPTKQPDRSLDLPKGVIARHSNDYAWQNISNELLPGISPRSARCSMQYFSLSPPRVPTADIDYWKGMQGGKWNAEIAKICLEEQRWAPTAVDKVELRRRILAGCASKNAAVIAAAMLDELNKKAATCDAHGLVAPITETRTFKQRDANTWTALVNVDTTLPQSHAVDCHATRSVTLWRSSTDNGGIFWNLTDATTLAPNAPAECAQMEATDTYTWFDHPRIPLACQYLAP